MVTFDREKQPKGATSMDTKDKTILITGSTDGVGRRVAEQLGRERARVLIHGRNAARGKLGAGSTPPPISAFDISRPRRSIRMD